MLPSKIGARQRKNVFVDVFIKKKNDIVLIRLWFQALFLDSIKWLIQVYIAELRILIRFSLLRAQLFRSGHGRKTNLCQQYCTRKRKNELKPEGNAKLYIKYCSSRKKLIRFIVSFRTDELKLNITQFYAFAYQSPQQLLRRYRKSLKCKKKKQNWQRKNKQG